jgi:hypothetical protein
LLYIAYGILVFVWFSPEDHQVWPVALLGTGLVGLLLLRFTLQRLGGQAIPARQVLLIAPLLGLITGAGACLMTVGLMFFKNALHNHIFLDYPPLLMLAMLERIVPWGAAGGLAGVGLALVWWMRAGVERTLEAHTDAM